MIALFCISSSHEVYLVHSSAIVFIFFLFCLVMRLYM